MNKKLSVAIIGAGRVAGGYDMDKIHGDQGIYTHAGAYKKDGRFFLKKICDINQEKADLFLRQWNMETALTDPNEIYNDYHDVVSICTPDATHFEVISNIIKHKAAKTIFSEKPLVLKDEEIRDIIRTSEENNVNVVVNFQRRFDGSHKRIKNMIAKDPTKFLAVNAYYMKGLEHIGITLIDTLTFLCGVPKFVYAYNRVFNRQVSSYTYEFILFFDSFNATVKTIDTEEAEYYYHIFEIDMLFADRRLMINDNSRSIETRLVGDYAYSGVKVLDDRNPHYEKTGYSRAMLNTVDYIYDITTGSKKHLKNTPEMSYANKLILDAVKVSYEKKLKIKIGEL